MVGSLRLDAAALLTLVQNLALAKTKLFNGLLGGSTTRHGARVCAHGSIMWHQSQEWHEFEDDQIAKLIEGILFRYQYAGKDNVLCEQDEKPRERSANDTTNIFDQPYFSA